MSMDQADLELRNLTYARFAELGRAPAPEEVGYRDDVIAGTDKDPARLSAGLSDDEPLDGAPGEELPAVAARS